MKKWVVVFFVLFWWIGCDWDLSDLNPVLYDVHIRNMSAVSGITVTFFQYKGANICDSLGPSPLSGIPVDKTISILGEEDYLWRVERTIDSVLVDSGYIDINCEKWLLVEEENGIWSCTWSDTAWE